MERPEGAVRLDAPVAGLPGNRAGYRDRRGGGAGPTINVPLPPGATGDAALAAIDDIVAPRVDEFDPTWVLISAGFDAHRDDPLADLALSAGDFADLTGRVGWVRALGRPGGRVLGGRLRPPSPRPVGRSDHLGAGWRAMETGAGHKRRPRAFRSG